MPAPSDPDRREAATSRKTSESSSSPPPPDVLRRWGALVAGGEAPLPTNLTPTELSVVLTVVARLRRERLVKFIAGAIARDFDRERPP